MAVFNRKTNTVELTFDRYLKLLLTEQKYEQAVYALQNIGANEQFITTKDTNRILDFLGEDVFLYQNKEEKQ